MWHSQLAPIARRQHGLVTHTQAVQFVSPAHVRFLLRSGSLEPVRRGVYRIAGVPESWYQHLLAACLARPGAYASFRSAATLWQLTGFDCDILEITVPGTSRARLDGVVVHESRVIPSGHRVARRGIPVASVARTLCDLTAVANAKTLELAVDDALRRKLVTLRGLRGAAESLDGPGRRRSTLMKHILTERLPGFDPGGSPAELRILRLLVRAGLPKPVQQWRVRHGGRSARVDLAYPELGIVMEYDSWDFHKPRTVFDRDRDRGNMFEHRELTVLRFTSAWTDARIVEEVTEAYERAVAKRAADAPPSSSSPLSNRQYRATGSSDPQRHHN